MKKEMTEETKARLRKEAQASFLSVKEVLTLAKKYHDLFPKEENPILIDLAVRFGYPLAVNEGEKALAKGDLEEADAYFSRVIPFAQEAAEDLPTLFQRNAYHFENALERLAYERTHPEPFFPLEELDYSRVFSDEALVLSFLKNPEMAEVYLEEAVRLNPGSFELGITLFDLMKKNQRPLEERKATLIKVGAVIQSGPEAYLFYGELGGVMAEEGDYALGALSFEIAESYPPFPGRNFSKAERLCFLRAGEKIKAPLTEAERRDILKEKDVPYFDRIAFQRESKEQAELLAEKKDYDDALLLALSHDSFLNEDEKKEALAPRYRLLKENHSA